MHNRGGGAEGNTEADSPLSRVLVSLSVSLRFPTSSMYEFIKGRKQVLLNSPSLNQMLLKLRISTWVS